VWFSLIAPLLLAKVAPVFVMSWVIFLSVFRILKLSDWFLFLPQSVYRLLKHMRTPWAALTSKLPTDQPLSVTNLITAVLLPTYKEPFEVLDASIESVLTGSNAKNTVLVLATEERDALHASEVAAALREKYAHLFRAFLVTEHPADLPGEMRGKGPNARWGAQELAAWAHDEQIPFEHVIVTTADADTRFPAQYFPALTYLYLTTPDRTCVAYQPIATFLNNIWEARPISSLMALQTTFWQLVESAFPRTLLTFSTHAISLAALDEMDYWSTSVINEDSRQYYRAFFHFQGQFRVIPMYIPVYMDAVHVGSFTRTMKNLYLQQQRWAYGSEHTSYVLYECLRRKTIPFLDRWLVGYRQVIGHYWWGTQAITLGLLSWSPYIIEPAFRTQSLSAAYFSLSSIAYVVAILGIAMGSLLALPLLHLVKPPVQGAAYYYRMTLFFAQWLLAPIAGLLLGAFASIDSQTRLLTKRYLGGFVVTEKQASKRS
jgi:cellulose synthase/poly-beta-1,6-N-acetylglucosamine synthase-like glycosyltransferase